MRAHAIADLDPGLEPVVGVRVLRGPDVEDVLGPDPEDHVPARVPAQGAGLLVLLVPENRRGRVLRRHADLALARHVGNPCVAVCGIIFLDIVGNIFCRLYVLLDLIDRPQRKFSALVYRTEKTLIPGTVAC